MPDLSDEDLMGLFRSGKAEAFQILFDRYKDRVFRFVLRVYERNPSRAEDCTQEVFLRVIKGRDSFNISMRFSTWIYTIARNYCLNRLRLKATALETLTDSPESLEDCGCSGDSADILQNDDLGQIINRAVSMLPENLRAVFVMREIDGLSHAEIAEILKLNESNVRIQLHRAKQRLRNEISPYLEET